MVVSMKTLWLNGWIRLPSVPSLARWCTSYVRLRPMATRSIHMLSAHLNVKTLTRTIWRLSSETYAVKICLVWRTAIAASFVPAGYFMWISSTVFAHSISVERMLWRNTSLNDSPMQQKKSRSMLLSKQCLGWVSSNSLDSRRCKSFTIRFLLTVQNSSMLMHMEPITPVQRKANNQRIWRRS